MMGRFLCTNSLKRVISDWSLFRRMPNWSDHSFVCLEVCEDMKYGHMRGASGRNNLRTALVEPSSNLFKTVPEIPVQLIEHANREVVKPEMIWASLRFILNIS